jgi:hypothetical protein
MGQEEGLASDKRNRSSPGLNREPNDKYVPSGQLKEKDREESPERDDE